MRILRPGLALNRLPRAAVPPLPPEPTLQYPTDISGLLWWLDAGQDSRTEGQPITDWPDHSGNGHNWVSSNVNYPLIYHNEGGANGNPYVEFPWYGNDDPYNMRLDTPPTDVFSAHFFIILYIKTNPPPETRQAGLMTLGGGVTNTRYPDTNGVVYSNMLRSTVVTCTPWTGFSSFQNWHCLEISSVDNGYYVYVNGELEFWTTSNTFEWLVYALILGQGQNASNSNFVGGIAEWFIFDHVLSAGDRTAMNTYVTERYFP